MSIKIEYIQTKTSDEAYGKAKVTITPEKIEKYQVKAQLDYQDGSQTIIAKGKGFTLTAQFNETDMDLDLNLSIFLKPLRGRIEGSIAKEFKRIL
jgi:hypothetical protein